MHCKVLASDTIDLSLDITEYDCILAAQLIIIKTSYYRNFDKSTTDSGRNELHSDENSQNKPQKMQSSQQRKNSGITVLDSVDETEDEEDIKTKNLAKYLGMKDGVSASISGQVILLYLETYCLLPLFPLPIDTA